MGGIKTLGLVMGKTRSQASRKIIGNGLSRIACGRGHQQGIALSQPANNPISGRAGQRHIHAVQWMTIAVSPDMPFVEASRLCQPDLPNFLHSIPFNSKDPPKEGSSGMRGESSVIFECNSN